MKICPGTIQITILMAILGTSLSSFAQAPAPSLPDPEQAVLEKDRAPVNLDVEEEVNFEEEELDTKHTGEDDEEHGQTASLAFIPEHEREPWLVLLPLSCLLLAAFSVSWRKSGRP